eukprot:365747-Chlamydomonas_euryale.AAC.46
MTLAAVLSACLAGFACAGMFGGFVSVTVCRRPKAGDHGDPDLSIAVAELQAANVHVPLVTFGHMHHMLKGETSHVCSHALHSVPRLCGCYVNVWRVEAVVHMPG